ncbi:MAG: GSCFA domain-containing protein [Tannerellaceae bacterium]|nr:GSCFA domain-containing protein [Tannerellaceae bacterium]
MDFRTIISIPKVVYPVSHRDKTMLLGSCFVENIGKRLQENKFPVDLNPFGIIYNPASVATSLMRLLNPEPFTPEDLFEWEGLYHSFMHHSRFSGTDGENVLTDINRRLYHSSSFLADASCLVITFGTAWVYHLKSTGQIVSNCHKLPDKFFHRTCLTKEEIVEQWQSLLQELWNRNSSLRILFTVSPVRHWKDGAHGNQLSKATLLLAIDELCRLFPDRLFYFPSYEILLDELRDYRFYATDMLHPSEPAIEYIWQRFAEFCFTTETQYLLKEWEVIRKALSHKPVRPDSDAYHTFITQTLLKIEQLQEKFPYFYVAQEKEILLSKLE